MKTFHCRTNKTYSITTVLFAVVMLFFVWSCNGSKTEIAKNTPKRDLVPVMKAENVTTIISDSGVTRFRISTPSWMIYDKTKEPYWFFPKGIIFERFNQKYDVEANMKSKRAIYFENKSLWRFDGDVVVKNLQGEIFETQQLYWDDAHSKFYSDKEIKISQKTKIITGIGFESNATLTRYIIRKPKGIIPVEGSH